MYIRYLDSCDISDNSDSSDSFYSRQKQTSLLNIVIFCISNTHHLGFGGLWVCAVSALVTPDSAPDTALDPASAHLFSANGLN